MVWVKRGISTDWEDFKNESLLNYLFQFFIGIIITDIYFYHAHRICHHPKLYKHIHKRHHEWIYTTCVASIYASWVENVFVNLSSVIIGPFLFGTNAYM